MKRAIAIILVALCLIMLVSCDRTIKTYGNDIYNMQITANEIAKEYEVVIVPDIYVKIPFSDAYIIPSNQNKIVLYEEPTLFGKMYELYIYMAVDYGD